MKVYKILFHILFILLPSSSLFAAGDETDDTLYAVAKIMVAVTLLSILLVVWLVLVYSEKNDTEGKIFKKPFSMFFELLTKSTPVEKEHEILLDHDYDGIRELNNRIPPWFHGLLWTTIIFAFVYMIRYHVAGSGNVQEEEYLEEIRLATVERQILIKTGAFLNEETVTVTGDPAALNSGKEIFIRNCAACHASDGGGLVGPNLTDDYWINGGGIKNIFKTIKYGVPQKGMISWQTQLNPTQIQEVSSYILNLHGTSPAVPKKPEGNKWEEAEEDTNKTGS
jgi:cytochrome c oxidase cbb3-type subunit 3